MAEVSKDRAGGKEKRYYKFVEVYFRILEPSKNKNNNIMHKYISKTLNYVIFCLTISKINSKNTLFADF